MARRAKNNFRITIDSHAQRALPPPSPSTPTPTSTVIHLADGDGDGDGDARHDGKIFRAFRRALVQLEAYV